MISRLAKFLGFEDNDQQEAIQPQLGKPVVLRKVGYRRIRAPKFDPSLFLSARDIWDSVEQDWRLFQAPDGRWIERPLYVAMVSKDTSVAPQRVSFSLHDGLGLRFKSLRQAGTVAFLNCKTGVQLGDNEVDAYLNHGGLVIGALDVSLSMFETKTNTSSQATVDLEGLPLWQVDCLVATEHLAIVKFALLQFGQALFMEGDTKETRVFLRLISEHWMPSFAWHIDIWHQLAAGVDRFRYSDVNYRARSREVVQIGVNILEFHGISSGSILCDPI